MSLRARVAARARFRCGYCLTPERVVGTPMDIDHIIPHALGGATEEDNLWLACSLCNGHKSDRVLAHDPLTGTLVRLFDPRHQDWHDHFASSEDEVHIIGVTAIGRATVSALNLNRSSLVESRQLWRDAGWHPPKD